MTPPNHSSPAPSFRGDRQPRQWLGVHFTCCHVYGRMYKNAAGDRYIGRCPRCGAVVQATVGEGGTSKRFFTTT